MATRTVERGRAVPLIRLLAILGALAAVQAPATATPSAGKEPVGRGAHAASGRQSPARAPPARPTAGQAQLLPRSGPEAVAHQRAHLRPGAVSRRLPGRGPALPRQSAPARV